MEFTCRVCGANALASIALCVDCKVEHDRELAFDLSLEEMPDA
jgi:hypothetical protein